MTQHVWIKSTLGHGEAMCKYCLITNREAAVLGKLNTCDRAPEPEQLATVINSIDRPYLEPDDVYIGRGSKWGNPFKIGPDGTREEVIEKFRHYAKLSGIDVAARSELKGKTLVCFCHPLPCHGDVLAEWANEGHNTSKEK